MMKLIHAMLSTHTLSALVLCLSLSSPLAQAQVGRVPPIPDSAPRAHLKVVNNSTVLINGDPYPMSAAAQIRSTDNRILLTQSLPQGQEYYVRLLLDNNGALSKAWILTPAEAEQSYPRFKAPSKSN